MKVLDFKDIQRDDNFIYYRRKFHAVAVLQTPLKNIETPVEFSIETSPLGTKEIDIALLQPVDYPLQPVMQALRDSIKQRDSEGTLP